MVSELLVQGHWALLFLGVWQSRNIMAEEDGRRKLLTSWWPESKETQT
jgi:hypothetical protein